MLNKYFQLKKEIMEIIISHNFNIHKYDEIIATSIENMYTHNSNTHVFCLEKYL